MQDERPAVGLELHSHRDRHAAAVSGALLDPDEYGVRAVPVDLLDPRRVLEGMAGRHPIVVVGGSHQRRRKVLARRDVVVRRVRAQDLEHLRVIRTAIVGGPCPTDRELVEAEHVHHAHRRERRPEELGALVQDRPDEQAAVRSPGDREPRGLGDRVVDQELGGRDEVVEDVLLVFEHAAPVPALAVLAAAPEIHLRVHPAALQEDEVRRIEAGPQADVEAAVAVQESRVVAVPAHALLVGQEHGDPGAVRRGEEDLLGLVLLEVEGDLGRPVGLGFAGREVVPVHRRREEE